MIASRERNGQTPSASAPEKRNAPSRTDNSNELPASKFDAGKIEESIATFVRDHTGTSLLIAIAIGGIAGWFLKRKM